MKVNELMKDIKSGIFGQVIEKVSVIEFQKRGLPHVHILLILAERDKPKTIEDYDQLISAEIPDKDTDPEAYETVTKFMIHGPCGHLNPNSPCMVDGKCSKRFPKEFAEETKEMSDG